VSDDLDPLSLEEEYACGTSLRRIGADDPENTRGSDVVA
jgi:hypothetical protein